MDCQERELLNFLVYGYFGYTYDELENMYSANADEVIRCCAERAYLDFNRTLTYLKKDGQEMSSHERENVRSFREKVYGIEKGAGSGSDCDVKMIERIKGLLATDNQADFDKLHRELCTQIRDYANQSDLLLPDKYTGSKFHYGQAQKWVNMTLKYMMLLGFWKELRTDSSPSVRQFLHVPVDSYILKIAASRPGTKTAAIREYWLNVNAPRKDGEPDNVYSADHTLPWSRWNAEHYESFLSSLDSGLNPWCKSHPNAARIDWEGPAWIAQAKLERERKT